MDSLVLRRLTALHELDSRPRRLGQDGPPGHGPAAGPRRADARRLAVRHAALRLERPFDLGPRARRRRGRLCLLLPGSRRAPAPPRRSARSPGRRRRAGSSCCRAAAEAQRAEAPGAAIGGQMCAALVRRLRGVPGRRGLPPREVLLPRPRRARAVRGRRGRRRRRGRGAHRARSRGAPRRADRPAAADVRPAVAEIGRATGREVGYVPVSASEYTAALDGEPAEVVELIAYLVTEVLDGRASGWRTASARRSAASRATSPPTRRDCDDQARRHVREPGHRRSLTRSPTRRPRGRRAARVRLRAASRRRRPAPARAPEPDRAVRGREARAAGVPASALQVGYRRSRRRRRGRAGRQALVRQRERRRGHVGASRCARRWRWRRCSRRSWRWRRPGG